MWNKAKMVYLCIIIQQISLKFTILKTSLKQLAKSSMSKLGHPPMPPITITVQGVDKLLT